MALPDGFEMAYGLQIPALGKLVNVSSAKAGAV